MISVTHAVSALTLLNVLASLLFAHDKRQATRSGRRVPRSYLVIVLAVAPFLPTAVMVALHHKTRKMLFMSVSVVAGLLHLIAVVLMAKWLRLDLYTDWLWRYAAVAALTWMVALAVQLKRGCACEPSSDHRNLSTGRQVYGQSV